MWPAGPDKSKRQPILIGSAALARPHTNIPARAISGIMNPFFIISSPS
jgi:hypothetical protein